MPLTWDYTNICCLKRCDADVTLVAVAREESLHATPGCVTSRYLVKQGVFILCKENVEILQSAPLGLAAGPAVAA